MGAHKKPQGTEGLLSVAEMCEEWFCDKNTIFRYIIQGMPVHRIEKRTLFDLKECQRWYRGER